MISLQDMILSRRDGMGSFGLGARDMGVADSRIFLWPLIPDDTRSLYNE